MMVSEKETEEQKRVKVMFAVCRRKIISARKSLVKSALGASQGKASEKQSKHQARKPCTD